MASRSVSPTVSIVNLGCPKNQVEAEKMTAAFQGAGCKYSPDTLSSDIVLINTCGFIGPAKSESVDTILSYLELKKERPDLKVVVSGCLFERYEGELAGELPEVDGWLKLPSPERVSQLVTDLGFTRTPRVGPPAYGRPVLLNEPGIAYLKLSEGCDRPCSFCAIPAIKGAMRSRPIAELVEEARQLALQHGVREINLIAQDPAAYGKDLYGAASLTRLLKALGEVSEVTWFRILYMFPFGLDDEALDYLGSQPRFCAYLDMPLQHSERSVLARMRRPGDGPRYLEYLEKVRARWPGVALRTTMLVGHPGETGQDFDALCEFVRQARFQWLGVFPFSPEEGTFSHGQEGEVPEQEANLRAETLREVFEASRDLSVFRLGQARTALVTELTDGVFGCRTQSEAPEVDGMVYAPRRRGVKPGDLVELRVDEVSGFDFEGEILRKIATAPAAADRG
ncbi:MAG: 30S ribosomal protein S12 methylthiotransferase RimO [Candidatus Wallbacteria bacterium]|nr:30S ribosomal protein S12 methylthiotransferase RimO [Candidatus Wallbacteria bacterium]